MTELNAARSLLASALDLAPDAIPDSARLGDPERWDSLAHMRLILAIEARLGHEIDPEQIVRIESLADIASVLET